MFKALLQKQFREMTAFLTNSRKTGGRRSPKATVGFALFFGGILLLMMFSFGMMAWPLAQAMVPVGQGWLYFLSMELMALLMAVLMGAFAGYSGLFAAKDNDLLLAMPIPPWMILAVRLLGLLANNFACVLLAWVPTVAVYAVYASHPMGAALCALPTALFLAGIAAMLSVLLGWIVAETAGRLRHKNAVTVVLSLVLLGGYYAGVHKIQTLLQELLWELSQGGEGSLKRIPLLEGFGRVACGDGAALLLFAVGTAAAMAAFCGVLGRHYLHWMTTKRTAKKAVYRAKKTREVSLRRALLRRELLHLASSPAYLLNCALGTVMLGIVGGVFLVKAEQIYVHASERIPAEFLPLLLCAIVCGGLAANLLAAPAVSLEGKSFWIIRSLPVTAWQTLRAKLDLHLLLTAVPAAFCTLCGGAAFRTGVGELVLVLLVVLLFSGFTACFDLMAGLLWPNLHWISETAVIKQSLSGMAALFGSWAAGLLLTIGGFALLRVLPGTGVLVVCACLLAAADALLLHWLKGQGCRRLEEL